jgi:hypothetical protein
MGSSSHIRFVVIESCRIETAAIIPQEVAMFYEVEIPQQQSGAARAKAMVVLDPSESRRLVAKATVSLPEVQDAFHNGIIIIGRGVTNAFVTEELLGVTVEPKAGQTVGMVCGGVTTGNSGPPPCPHHVIKKGTIVEEADSKIEILDFGPNDVFIKGANAIDPEGNAGIFASSLVSGTIGMAWPVVTARGSHLIMPVGLEKLIPSVIDAARCTGIYDYKYSMGLPAKLTPVVLGEVVTEIQALAILAGVKATHVGSGGVGGSEGAVVLVVEGSEPAVDKAFEIVKSIKGEPVVTVPDTLFVKSARDFDFDPASQLATLGKR